MLVGGWLKAKLEYVPDEDYEGPGDPEHLPLQTTLARRGGDCDDYGSWPPPNLREPC